MVFGLINKEKKINPEQLKADIIAKIKTIFDPEIPVSIYDLGLIYEININDKYEIHIKMTLTTPACPVAQSLPASVEQAVTQVEGVVDCEVEIVWDPPWTTDLMSEAAKLELGLL